MVTSIKYNLLYASWIFAACASTLRYFLIVQFYESLDLCNFVLSAQKTIVDQFKLLSVSQIGPFFALQQLYPALLR